MGSSQSALSLGSSQGSVPTGLYALDSRREQLAQRIRRAYGSDQDYAGQIEVESQLARNYRSHRMSYDHDAL